MKHRAAVWPKKLINQITWINDQAMRNKSDEITQIATSTTCHLSQLPLELGLSVDTSGEAQRSTYGQYKRSPEIDDSRTAKPSHNLSAGGKCGYVNNKGG